MKVTLFLHKENNMRTLQIPNVKEFRVFNAGGVHMYRITGNDDIKTYYSMNDYSFVSVERDD